MKIFTIFCQEANGLGTVHIDVIRDPDLETAIQKGKNNALKPGPADLVAKRTYGLWTTSIASAWRQVT